MIKKIRVFKKEFPAMADEDAPGFNEELAPFDAFYCAPGGEEDAPRHQADEVIGIYTEE